MKVGKNLKMHLDINVIKRFSTFTIALSQQLWKSITFEVFMYLNCGLYHYMGASQGQELRIGSCRERFPVVQFLSFDMFLSDGVDSKNGANENRSMLSDSEIDKFISLVSARKFFLT